MRILIVTARFPDPAGKGDQQRSLQFAQLLSADHDVRVLAPAPAGGTATPAAGPAASQLAELERIATVTAVRVGAPERAIGAARALLAGRPVQVGWMTPGRFARETVAAAAQADIVIAVTIRCLPDRLPAPTVLDHVDALSANMRERAALERRRPLRAAARFEAWLLARHERRAARWVAAQTVVSPIDAAALPPHPTPVVIPLVVELGGGAQEISETRGIGDVEGTPPDRDIDVILTGDMRYPPNRDAAEWLAGEIVPALRISRPHARVVVAGRRADTLPPLAGVEVLSDVPDIGALLARARVAAVPLRRGTGTPIKLHEAAARGAAPVATRWVADAVGADVDGANDAETFAAAIGRLLDDEPLRRARVLAVRDSLRGSSSETVARRLNELLRAVVNTV